MAEPIVRSFVIDTTESEQNLKELNVQINATSTAINQGAQSFENVAAAEETVVASSKSLKAQLRDLQAQLANTAPDSAKYRELSQAAGELKDKIQDAAQAVGTQAGGAFERVSGSLGLVTSRIANLDFTGAAEGAKLLAANIGSIKLDDVTAGLQSLGSTLISVGKSVLTNPLFLIGGAIAAIIVYWEDLDQAIKSLNPELERQKALTKSLNEEINKQSTSVGKQISQVNALFNAVQDQTKAETERKEALEALQTLYPDIFKNQNIDINNTDALTSAKLTLIQAIEAEAKANAAKVLIEQQYAKQFELQVKLAEEQAKLTASQAKEAEIVANSSRKTAAEIEQFTLKVTQAGNETANAAANVAKLQQEVATNAKNIADIEKVVGDTIVKQTVQTANAKKNENKKVVAEKKKDNKQEVDNEKKKLEEQAKLLQDYYDKLAAFQDEKYEDTLTKEEQEELAIIQKYEALFAAADAANQSTIDLQKQLNAELAALDAQRTANAQAEADKRKQIEQESLNKDFLNSYQSLQNEFIAAEDERYFNSLNNTEQEELRITQKYEALFAKADAAGKDTTKLQKELSEKIKEIQDKAAAGTANSLLEQFNKGIELAGQSLNAFNSLADTVFSNRMSKVKKGSKEEEALAKKQFKFQKASQIAAATIDTAKAITAAISANPFPSPTLPIAISLASVTGAAQIAKIAATKFESGGSTTPDTTTPSVGGGGTESQPAQFNPLASSFLQERPEQITPRAYVLASDVASAAEVRENVADLARIG